MNSPNLKKTLMENEEEEHPSELNSENNQDVNLDHIEHFIDHDDKTMEESQMDTSSNHKGSINLRRSILKTKSAMSVGKKKRDGKRISFHENLKEVHEVENWKEQNRVKRTCCQTCWEECRLI